MSKSGQPGDEVPPGWYPHPTRDEMIQYWTGEKWGRAAVRGAEYAMTRHSSEVKLRFDVEGYIGMGVVLGIIGGILWGSDPDLMPFGIFLFGVGQFFLLIGVIGKGVQVGMHAHRQDYGL